MKSYVIHLSSSVWKYFWENPSSKKLPQYLAFLSALQTASAVSSAARVSLAELRTVRLLRLHPLSQLELWVYV
jgi:hypothetical protein